MCTEQSLTPPRSAAPTCNAEAGAERLINEQQGRAPGPGSCREDVMSQRQCSWGYEGQGAGTKLLQHPKQQQDESVVPQRAVHKTSAPGLACKPSSSSTSCGPSS